MSSQQGKTMPGTKPWVHRLHLGVVQLWSRTRLHVEVALWRHGMVWGLILLLASVCVLGDLLLRRPGAVHNATLEMTLAQRRMDAVRDSAVEAKTASPSPASVLGAPEQLRELLPPRASLTEQVLKLHELARASQLQLSQVVYSDIGLRVEVPLDTKARGQAVHREPGDGGFERIRLHLPLRASYPQLRRFLESVLLELPNASLDQLSIKRGSVGEMQLDVAVRLSLWLRRDSASTADSPEAANATTGASDLTAAEAASGVAP